MELEKKVRLLEFTRCLQSISDEFTTKEIAKHTGYTESHINQLYGIFKRDAYKVFQPNILDICIDSLAISNKLSIVQVGAYDGKTRDPIYQKNLEHGGKILLIEPQESLRESLLKNYSNFRGELHIEHVAIGSSHDKLEFHILKSEYWEEYKNRTGKWPNPMFSLNKKHVAHKSAMRLGININEIDQYLTTLEVDIIPLKSLLNKYNFKEIDLLQIDAEGYDFQIINSLDNIRPKLIHFESFNLSKEDWKSFKSFCEVKGYGYIQGLEDTLAIYGSNIKHEIYLQGVEGRASIVD